MTLFKKIIDKQKTLNHDKAKPINLEALVNSGRVRVADDKLKKIEDQSRIRKAKT
jgi:hypothetical protein